LIYSERIISKKDVISNALIWFAVLTSIQFYSLFISWGMGKAVVFLGAITVVFFLVIHIVYGKVQKVPMKFTIEAWIFILALIISPLSALIFHEQSIPITLYGQSGIYFIFLYFLLHQIRPDPEQLMKMFITLGYLYCGVYVVQYIVYPIQLVSSTILEDRGTIRIFLPGSEYLFSGYFILLGRYFMYKKAKYLLYIIPYLIILLLMGTRQMIASLLFASLISVLLSRTIKSKALTYMVLALCMIPLYFVFKDIFLKMFEVSFEQSEAGLQENVRYKAAVFFLSNYNPNKIWILIGNGIPETLSKYGRDLAYISEYAGYYLDDIGLLGDLFRFGIFFIVAKIVIYIRLASKKTQEKFTFIRYNNITILLTMFTGGGINASILVLMSFMMYIMDVNDLELLNKKKLPAVA
jgi:hypothetical protein